VIEGAGHGLYASYAPVYDALLARLEKRLALLTGGPRAS